MLTDFAAVITDQCDPLRTADEATELEQLKVNYEGETGAVGHAVAGLNQLCPPRSIRAAVGA